MRRRIGSCPGSIRSAFAQTLAMQRYAIRASDYGAPVGWRLAVAHPERITAIVTQNSNAYEEGLSEGWNPIEKYWKEPSEVNRKAPREFLRPESIKWQYPHGVADPERVAPKAYTLDSALISRPGNDEIQLDLFLDYTSNVARYPEFQAYFREYIRRCWRHGENTISSSCRQMPKRSMSSAITRATRPRLGIPKSTFLRGRPSETATFMAVESTQPRVLAISRSFRRPRRTSHQSRVA